MNALILVTARGGSKGVPGKNIKPLAGRPLIHYTLDVARELEREGYGTLCVSTDSEEIRRVTEEYGVEVPFLRPPHLATDEAGSYGVILHALDWYEEERGQALDPVILLQPTSPFRRLEHVHRAIGLWESEGRSPKCEVRSAEGEVRSPKSESPKSGGLEMVVSVTEADATPYYGLYEENEEGFLEPSKPGDYRRRQDAPAVWELNGAVYVMGAAALRQAPPTQFTRVRKMVMDRRSSLEIDTPLDWKFAECLAAEEE